MLELSRKRAIAALTGAALSCVAPTVLAADCESLGLPNPIYGAGGSAETQTISAVATYLAGLADHPITVFWWDPGACQGYQSYLNDSITNSAVKFWHADGTADSCNATAHYADFAHMGNDHSFCVKGGLTEPSGYPDGFGTILAPVQTLNVITDKDSSQKSISQEALYYIFGFGAAAGGVSPWTDPVGITTRNPTSFASQMLADAIFGDSTRAVYEDPGKNGAGDTSAGYNGRLGFRGGTQGDVVTQVAHVGDSSPESALGYVSGSAIISDEKKGRSVKVLAYQAHGQTCGYWPDLTESSKDKLNVRTGKYALWAPGHFYYKTTGSDFANPDVKTFVEAFVGSHDLEVLNRVIDNGDVPLCAMQVDREGLSGPISSVAPEDPCGCYFESRTAGTAQCDSCREGHNDDCSEDGAVCRRGYCEAY